MASNDFKGRDRGLLSLSTRQESTYGRTIPGEEVSFASLKIPCLCLFDLSETIQPKKILAVVDSMEMGWRCIETKKNLLGIFSTLMEKIFCDCSLTCLEDSF